MELLEEQESHSFLSSGTEDEGNTFQTTPNSDLKTKGEVKQPNMASMFVESLASKEILKDKVISRTTEKDMYYMFVHYRLDSYNLTHSS